MYLMLQQEESDDYMIAMGESYQLALFIEIAFRLVGLDWRGIGGLSGLIC
jgi:GDPmannose 4,6-dehydratase